MTVRSWLSHIAGGQTSWMPTLVTVPATTGPKSQLTEPELLLIELLDEAVCAERRGLSWVNNSRNERESRQNKRIAPVDRTTRIDTPRIPSFRHQQEARQVAAL